MERGISVKKRTALGLAVSMATSYPVTLNALGLGELQSSSQLNQPLNAQIELLSTGEKEVGQLRVKLASADVFNRVGIDRPAYLNSLKFRTAKRNGKPVIVVSSDQPVKEPFLNFLLEVSWPQGQLLKEYTVLLDPPVLLQAGDTAPQNTASVRAEPKASGIVNRTDVTQAPPPQNQPQPKPQQTNLGNQQSTQNTQAQSRSAPQQSVLEAQARIAAAEEKQRTTQRATRRPSVTNSRATARAAGGKKYRVRAGDTMQKVTSRLRYSGTTNSQMMLALFKANPHAFSKNNINYLKKGVVLTQPPRSAVFETSKSAARAQIKQHYAAWKQYRKGVAAKTVAQQSTAPKTPATPTKDATKDVAKAAQNNSNNSENNGAASTDTGKAKLSVVGSQAGAANSTEVSGSANAELQKKLALAEEALASTSSKNVELESRVNKLEAIVRKKDRLITLKNEHLARLESQLAKDGQNAALVPSESAPKVNEAEDLATNVGNEADQNNNIIIRDDESQNPTATSNNANVDQETDATTAKDNSDNKAAPATLDHEKVADNTANTPTAIDPLAANAKGETDEGGLLDLLKSPLVATIGGGSLLALILGGLFLRRRQNVAAEEANKDFVDDSDLDGTFADTDFDVKRDESFDADFDATHEAHHEVKSNNEVLATNNKKDSDEEDALDKVLSADSSLDEDEVLQEADVYIVYGLHEQAEDELKKAIAENPKKLEYRYKLLENYQVADDSEAFVASAKDFLKAEGDNKQALWEKVVELGKKVAPENDMFAEKSSTKAASVFAGVAAVAGVAAAAGLATSDVVADANVANADVKSTEQSIDNNEAISSEEFESLLNTDIDLGFDDLDLGLDVSDVKDDADTELESLDLDSTLDDIETKKDDLDLSEFSDLGADDDFDFEGLDSLDGLNGLDDFEPDNSNVLNFKDVEPAISNDNDHASLNLEIDSSSGLDKVLPTGSYTSALDDGDDDNDALSFLNLPDDDQEMQDAHIGTKLDLARAYLDMGDVEGARCTLEEVVVEGNDAQKREAEEMLQQTG